MEQHKPIIPPAADRANVATLWPGTALAFAVFIAQVVYWIAYIHLKYFPAGDEFSLLVNSTRFFHPHLLSWFRYGFAGYFSPYPDLSLPYSNFLRPMANITLYCASLIFGRHWGSYLLVSYGIEAALVFTVWYIARICLKVLSFVALLVAISAALAPSFSYQVVFRPAFAFDLLGALWAMIVLASLLQRRWWTAWFFVVFAVLTKETAYYVSISACIAAFLLLRELRLMRRGTRAAAYLLPLLLVTVLRKIDFPSGQGVYVLNETHGVNPVKKFVLALTHWPYILPGEQHIYDLSAHNLLAVTLTLVSWALLAVLVVRTLRPSQGITVNKLQGETPTLIDIRVLLVFLGGSLLLPLGLDLAPRFGTSTIPLFFLCLGVLATIAGKSLILKWCSVALLAFTFVADAINLGVALTGQPLRREELLWSRSRNMVDLLSKEARPVVFLVGDATESYSSAISVQRFSAYSGTIVPLSNLSVGRCSNERLTISHEGEAPVAIHLFAPDSCGGNTLGATFHVTPTPVHAFVRVLPQANVSYNAHEGGWQNGQFATDDLDLLIMPKEVESSVIMPLSEASAGLREIALEPANHSALSH